MAIKKKAFGSRSFWAKLGADARTMYQNFIFDGGKYVYGSKWWKGRYSSEYSSAKRSGKIRRQAEEFSNDVTAVLTGDTLKDFSEFLNVNKTGFEFGFPTMGKRVKSLRKKKGKAGTLTSKSKPVPTQVSKFIAKEYHKWVKKNQYNQTRTHKKGRSIVRPKPK